jgi:hypothetical protein
MKLKDYLLNEAPIQTKGWTKKSLEKFGKTIGKMPDEKGFFEACVMKMKSKEGFDEEKAKGFCAAIKDAQYDSPMWRGADKTEKEIKQDIKKKKFPKSLPEK